jgi:hypothetical protein
MAVELYIEDELIDLIGDEKIQTDYAIAEIGNFSTRQGFRGINFDIPKTANNKAILENSDIVNNTTVRPYRRLKARVYVDGIDQNIRFADIESIQDNFNIRLYGGNANFFEIIKGKLINSLQYLISLAHPQTLTEVYDSRQYNDGYIYPLIDWHADSPNNIMNNTSKTFDVRYCYPCLFVNELIENICVDAGYTLVNDLLNDVNYQKADLIFCPTFNKPQYYNGDAKTQLNTVQNSIFENPVYYKFPEVFTSSAEEVQKETGTWTTDGAITGFPITVTDTIYFYEVPVSGEYVFTLNGTGNQTLPVVAFILKRNGTTLEEVGGLSSTVGPATWEVTFNYTVNALAGEQYIAYFFSFTAFTIDNANFYYLSNVLNFKYIESKLKQSDLLRAYLQMFCLLINVNEDTKTVYINKFNDISNNIGLALDWSSKLDYTDNEQLEFELDKYAQSNTLTYKEDDSIDPTFIQGSNGTINIDDETLDSVEEFVELPFAATEMDSRLQAFVIPKIKIFRTNDDSPPETKPTDKVEPRILFLNRETTVPSVIYSDGTSTLTTNVDLPLPWFMLAGKEVNLGFANNLIPLYYGGLQSVLTRTKIVTENIRLNALDIQALDFLKPIYLDKHNAYFYISKISGFDYGSSEATEVELVKIR